MRWTSSSKLESTLIYPTATLYSISTSSIHQTSPLVASAVIDHSDVLLETRILPTPHTTQLVMGPTSQLTLRPHQYSTPVKIAPYSTGSNDTNDREGRNSILIAVCLVFGVTSFVIVASVIALLTLGCYRYRKMKQKQRRRGHRPIGLGEKIAPPPARLSFP